jgi:hypothetical protein
MASTLSVLCTARRALFGAITATTTTPTRQLQPTLRWLSLSQCRRQTSWSTSVRFQHNSLLGTTATQRALRVLGGTMTVGLIGFAVTFPFVWTSNMRDVPKIFITALERYSPIVITLWIASCIAILPKSKASILHVNTVCLVGTLRMYGLSPKLFTYINPGCPKS